MIRDATEEDARSIAEIYNHYILNSVITFEEETVNIVDMKNRIKAIQASGFSCLVAEDAGKVIGYAYSSKWQDRSAYRHTAEVTVYLSHTIKSEGWGTKLYNELFYRLREKSIHTVIGGITLPNPASIALHEKFGMKQVAHFKQVGFKFEQWLDVGYWQVQIDN